MEPDKDRPKLGRLPCGVGFFLNYIILFIVGLVFWLVFDIVELLNRH